MTIPNATRKNQHARSVFTIEEAARGAPLLAQLSAQVRESTARLEIVRPLLPEALRARVSAGPFDERGWCLFVPHNAAAAKLRQLKPLLMEALNASRLPVADIKVKVRKYPSDRP